MAELKEGDWVLVADAGKALFLVNKGDEVHPHLVVRRKTEHENPADSEQGTDKPGRMPDTGVGQRSALQETDWHELEKDRFADDLAAAPAPTAATSPASTSRPSRRPWAACARRSTRRWPRRWWSRSPRT